MSNILAAAAAATGDKILLFGICWLKPRIEVFQNHRTANAHHPQQVLCHFKQSSPFYGRFSVQEWPFSACFQDDHPQSSGRSPVRQVGVSNQGRSSSIAIGLPVLSHHFYAPSIAPLFTAVWGVRSGAFRTKLPHSCSKGELSFADLSASRHEHKGKAYLLLLWS